MTIVTFFYETKITVNQYLLLSSALYLLYIKVSILETPGRIPAIPHLKSKLICFVFVNG